MKARVCLIVGMSLFVGRMAQAEWLAPPLHAPDWWKVPGDAPDGVTRTLYRSFVTGPESPDDNGDYTYDGFTPSIADDWTDNLHVGFPIPYGADCPGYGDGYCLVGPAWLDVTLGNRSWDGGVKWYFVQIVGHTLSAIDHRLESITTLDNISAPWMDPDFVSFSDWIDCDNDGYVDICVLTFTGKVLVDQPDWETFGFIIAYDYVDSMWIGTHCVGEPGTLALLVAGVAALMPFVRLRRRSN